MAEYGDYVNPADMAEADPYLFARRGLLGGLRALPGSAQTLTPEEFQALLSGQQGAYGPVSVLQYDPTFGIYTGPKPGQEVGFGAMIENMRSKQSVPFNIDPRLMTDVERIRSNMMGGGTYGRSFTDNDIDYRLGAGSFAQRIGDKKYFVNQDGTVTAYDVTDIDYDYTPTFPGQDDSPYYRDLGADNDDDKSDGRVYPALPDDETGTNPVTNYTDQLNQYYQELFNRAPRQAGIDYFNQQIAAGNINPDNLRQTLINAASPLDRMYYEGTQSGDPVFAATQELFGRNPARGQQDPETGQFTGGYGQYMSRLESGDLTEDQLRRNLVNLAYDRGQGSGQSADYQAYLDSLGIDRTNNPFAIDGGFAKVGYGSDLSQYQALADAGAGAGDGTGAGAGTDTGAETMPGFPGFPGKGGTGGMSGKGGAGGSTQTPPPQSGGTYQAGGGYRMPGQYITGNQLYSGLPYGMTQPMGYGGYGGGKGGGFGSPYGMSQQYMPNAGLMSGYSTGFGPYGGYQRPRFGGGKGGPRIQPYPYPMGGGKGGGYGGYNPYAMGSGYNFGQSTGQSYEDVVRAGGGGINPVVGPNGERLFDQ